MVLDFLFGYSINRSPLAPAVPIEGSDTVQGLRTLERLRASNLLNNDNPRTSGRAASASKPSRRSKYQRFKGPFIEHMTIEDLKRDPKPWKVFAINGDDAQLHDAYNIPASLDILFERFEENIAAYLPNYLRLSLLIIMLTFYLRPIALLGGISLAASLYFNFSKMLEEQQAAAQQAAAAHQNPNTPPPPPRVGPLQDPTQQMTSAALTLLSWFLVAYTRCIPIITLALSLAVLVVSLHASTRRAASEYRYKGRLPLGYTVQQVIGRSPVGENCDPKMVFKQGGAAVRQAVVGYCTLGARYSKFYALSLVDLVKRPFTRTSQPGWN